MKISGCGHSNSRLLSWGPMAGWLVGWQETDFEPLGFLQRISKATLKPSLLRLLTSTDPETKSSKQNHFKALGSLAADHDYSRQDDQEVCAQLAFLSVSVGQEKRLERKSHVSRLAALGCLACKPILWDWLHLLLPQSPDPGPSKSDRELNHKCKRTRFQSESG